jgi:hypothetical protein
MKIVMFANYSLKIVKFTRLLEECLAICSKSKLLV